MFVTTLNFSQVLERFYEENKYDFLLLFVSSFDGRDKEILKQVVDNATRIDKITGERICFYYFIQDESLNEICRNFHITSSDLPAFILIPKDKRNKLHIFSTDKCLRFKDSLEILCDFVELSDACKKGIEYRDKRTVKIDTIEKLNRTIDSCYGEFLVEYMQNTYSYSFAVLKIWDLIKTRDYRMSRCFMQDKFCELYNQKFDVFISCQSQNYIEALKFCIYLREHGFKPFVTDYALKELGIIEYDEIVERILCDCPNIIVFYTDDPSEFHLYRYHNIEYKYILHHRCKPGARIVNVLSQYSYVPNFPEWMEGKWYFIDEIYNKNLLRFLNKTEKQSNQLHCQQLRDEIDGLYFHCKSRLYLYDSPNIKEDLYWLERTKEYMLHEFDNNQFLNDSNVLENYSLEMKRYIWKMERILKMSERRYIHGFDVPEVGSSCVPPDSQCSFHGDSDKNVTESHKSESVYYSPSCSSENSSKSYSYTSFWDRLFNRRTYEAFSSIFAPAEIKPNSHMLVQVYLHLLEETEKVKGLAQESQKGAQRRDYIPLQCKLKKGDKVDVLLNIYGESLLMSDKKSMVWQGSFTKCSFDFFVSNDIEVNQLRCKAILSVNRIPVGEMNFITCIMDDPRPIDPVIISHNYKKVFISYAHKDVRKVKYLAQGFELMKIDYFFDRKYLKAGDIYPQVIKDYINSADLFILCWSKNAAQSDYVKKEYTQALGRVIQQEKSQEDTNLSISTISIVPRAELPAEMKDNYHFGEV